MKNSLHKTLCIAPRPNGTMHSENNALTDKYVLCWKS